MYMISQLGLSWSIQSANSPVLRRKNAVRWRFIAVRLIVTSRSQKSTMPKNSFNTEIYNINNVISVPSTDHNYFSTKHIQEQLPLHCRYQFRNANAIACHTFLTKKCTLQCIRWPRWLKSYLSKPMLLSSNTSEEGKRCFKLSHNKWLKKLAS